MKEITKRLGMAGMAGLVCISSFLTGRLYESENPKPQPIEVTITHSNTAGSDQNTYGNIRIGSGENAIELEGLGKMVDSYSPEKTSEMSEQELSDSMRDHIIRSTSDGFRYEYGKKVPLIDEIPYEVTAKKGSYGGEGGNWEWNTFQLTPKSR